MGFARSAGVHLDHQSAAFRSRPGPERAGVHPWLLFGEVWLMACNRPPHPNSGGTGPSLPLPGRPA